MRLWRIGAGERAGGPEVVVLGVERKLTHTPFLVFHEEEGAIRVHIVDSSDQLLRFPDETPVMGQWQGNYQSDFFQFTINKVFTSEAA